MNLENATLVLRTSSTDINVGNYNNDCTWNINLQQVLGSMYSKYTKFKFCITSFGNAGGGAISDLDRIVEINVEGLQWINQTYNTTTGSNLNNTVVSTADLLATGRTINYTGETGAIFLKPYSNMVDIRIYLKRIVDNTLQDTQFPQMTYCFSIYGVE